MNVNLPIYRAKTIKQDYPKHLASEYLQIIDGYWYAIGFYDYYKEKENYLGEFITKHLMLIRRTLNEYFSSTAEEIDPTTLAIHFPDMKDSENNPIFASLSEDGKGGDIVGIIDTDFKYTYKYIKAKFMLDNMELLNPYLKFKFIGIQE
ncbi:hypothetical protein [Sulfurimonas sp.]|uniref:hypothetical protein n=1 Tax=Sulfurimonas sp. TaxID=2022749 RepID=UPI003D1222B2